jgi:hypothetical protein
MLKATLLAAALAAASVVTVQAQTPPSPAKKELIARVLKLQQPDLENTARALTEQPAMQMWQQAGQVLQRLPAERRDAVAQDIQADLRKYVEETTPIVRERAIRLAPTTIGTVLDERLSEDELRQIVAMLESPTVTKYRGLFPDMQRALSEKLLGDVRGEVEPRLRAAQQTVAQRLGVAPSASASASASAPKAAAAKASAPSKK